MKQHSFFIIICLFSIPVFAQENQEYRPMTTDLAITPSPAYQMLDANASLVGRPAINRDFKVDWSLKSYRLAPNLALEVQPVWLALYSGKNNIGKYRKAGYLVKTLSTLGISAGTLDGNDTTRFFSYAGKITLFQSRDPLMDKNLYNEYENNYYISYQQLQDDVNRVKESVAFVKNPEAKDSLIKILLQKEFDLYQIKKNFKDKIKQQQEEYKAQYWNTSNVEIAFGRAFAFNPKLSERIDSLKFSNTGNAFWLNAGLGLGKHWLITAVVRTISHTEFARTTVIDPFNSVSTTTLDKKRLFDNSLGINFRYGSIRYSFFIEGFYNQGSRLQPILLDLIDTGNDLLVQENKLTIGYGGDLKLGNNVLLNYGIRSIVSKSFKVKGVIPIASVTCLMR
jgi:hypothetical protein